MTTTKSPKDVARNALAAGKAVFRNFSHKFSPKKFTLPQLFACLALKEYEKKDYRGVCQLLTDCSDLRDAIELTAVPHFTTLHKAGRRLLKLGHVRELVTRTAAAVQGRAKAVAQAAVDSSGFDARHASRYFVWRCSAKQAGKGPKKRISYKRFAKLMVVVNCAVHSVLAAAASTGPTPDIDQMEEVVRRLPQEFKVRSMAADAGFDSAANHKLLRETLGIRSVIPPGHGRPPKDPSKLPADKWRRLMRTRFNHKAYRHRSQIETVFSMMKRNLGSALRGRTSRSRDRDLYLKVVTHNITLIR